MKEKTSRLLTFLYTTSVGNRLLRILVSPVVSKAAGCVMNSRLSLLAVSGFIKSQNIDVSEFEKTSFSSYNDFFTRKLKPDARLLAQGDDILISPCDAKLTIFPITNDSRFLIKQGQYTVQSLLRDKKLAKQFEGGILQRAGSGGCVFFFLDLFQIVIIPLKQMLFDLDRKSVV